MASDSSVGLHSLDRQHMATGIVIREELGIHLAFTVREY
jgi:hypothetical protein